MHVKLNCRNEIWFLISRNQCVFDLGLDLVPRVLTLFLFMAARWSGSAVVDILVYIF